MSPQTDALQALIVDVERVAAATAEIEAAGFKVVPADELVPPELLKEAEKITPAMVALACLIHRGEQKKSYEAAVSIAKQVAKLCKRMTGAKDPTGKNYEHTTEVWEIREQAYWEGVLRGRREQGKGLPS